MKILTKGYSAFFRICACLFAVLFLCLLPSAHTETLPVDALSDNTLRNGIVRVYLSSLNEPHALDLELSAAYRVYESDVVLPAGANVKLSVNDADGQIKLNYAGQNWLLGEETILLRSTEEGVLQIQQAIGAGTYPADLRIRSVAKKDAYYLEVIACIRVEDYLPDVLSYAIISTAPAEALKAQAVVSRTYAMLAMQNNVDNPYDLVDSGADQIYRGNRGASDACIAAVNETAGCVLTYNGELAKMYYCPSNGGQTEAASNVWNDGGYPYLTIQDDAYDLASPTAFAKVTVLDKDLQNGSVPPSLLILLRPKVIAALNESGYAAADDNTTLLTLDNVSLNTPKFAEPSKLYTKADFTLTAETVSSAGEKQNAVVTVTADIFDELEQILGMSLQSNDNELWSVGVQDTSVVLKAARYGHGVGMSQCGAIEMAKQGKDVLAILDFYYPGCLNTQYNLSDKTLREVLEDKQNATATPTPSTTPQPIDVVASVEQTATQDPVLPAATPVPSATPAAVSEELPVYYTYVAANDFVNLRSAPNMQAEILTVALHGEKLRVLDVVNGWALVERDGLRAYAVCNLLSKPVSETGIPSAQATPAPSATPAQEYGSASVAATVYAQKGTVNFREYPSKTANVLMRLYPGTIVEVTGISGDFCSVVYQDVSGYMMTEYLRFDHAAAPSATQMPPVPDTAVSDVQPADFCNARVTTNGGTLNLRAAPNGTARVIARIPQCAIVQAKEYNDEWSSVRYDGLEGYVMTAFLTFGDNYAAEILSGQMNIALPEYSIGTAVITVPSGSLNLRRTPCPYGTVVALVPGGDTVEVYTLEDGWALVTYKEYVGYVSETYLTIPQNETGTQSDAPSGENEVPSPVTETVESTNRLFPAGYESAEGVTAVVKTVYTKLFHSDTQSSRVLDVIAQGVELPVLAVGSEWCIVAWQNQAVYVLQSDVEFRMQ